MKKAMSRIAPRDYKESVIPKMTVNSKSISSNKSTTMFNPANPSTQDMVESKSFSGPRRTTIIRTIEPPSSKSMGGPKRRNHFKFKMDSAGNVTTMDNSTLSGFEVQRLAKRFEKLDADNSGTLSIEEFMNLTELQDNHLAHRVISLFDQDKNGEVDFKEFIEGISVFSLNADRDNKLRFAFRIYDIDNDGFISNSDLFTVLQIMVGNNLKDNQLQEIVDRTILYADTDEDGKISYTEFCKVIGNESDVDRTILDIVVDV